MRYRFGTFELDVDRLLLSGTEREPIHVEPRVVDLLHYLVENEGRTVAKAELVEPHPPRRAA
ncbi:MAG TPA: hypothetical protein VMV46_02895 [Thermoanaerobaculia bacterium]|nr:hypothetical protein [Thermoanaerobaculia bacterium]